MKALKKNRILSGILTVTIAVMFLPISPTPPKNIIFTGFFFLAVVLGFCVFDSAVKTVFLVFFTSFSFFSVFTAFCTLLL